MGGKDVEGRRAERRHLIYYLRVFEQDGGELVGYLADLTTEGFMVISDRKIAAGRTFGLRMDLPKKMKGSRQVLFKARSMWCKPDANPDFYNTGYRIVGLSKEDARTIDGLIRDFFYEEPEEE